MASLFRQFGFAGVVLGLVVLAVAAVVGKTALDAMQAPPGAGPGNPANAAAGSAPKGPPGAAPGGQRGAEPARVRVETVAVAPLFDVVQALGTAQARESVVITSKITDAIQSIRFESGDRVRRGQILVVLASVEQQADLAEAKAQLEAAKRDAERFVELGERGFAPTSRVEEARAAFERAQARVSALESRIADRTIRAPFSGVMGLRTASPGALARPGEPIATLDDLSAIKLDFDVPESQIPFVKVGAAIEARTAALGDRVFKGNVETLDSRLNANTRTLRARAILANPDGALKPGMLLTVGVRHNPRDAISVPEIALMERSDGLFVFRVDAQQGRQVAALAPVRVGRRVDGRAEVVSGLKAGEIVVVEGVQRVRPGQPVADVAAAAAPAASPPAASPPSAVAPTPKAAPPKTAPRPPTPSAPPNAEARAVGVKSAPPEAAAAAAADAAPPAPKPANPAPGSAPAPAAPPAASPAPAPIADTKAGAAPTISSQTN